MTPNDRASHAPRPGAGATGTPPGERASAPEREDLGEVLQRAWQRIEAIGHHVRRLGQLQIERGRRSIAVALLWTLLLAWLALTAVTVTILAAVALMEGLAGAWSAVLGAPAWAGQLAAAFTIFLLGGLGWLFVSARGRRRRLERYRRKFDPTSATAARETPEATR